MKATLPKAALAALVESREALAAALKDCQPAAEKLAAIQSQIESLPGEIERHERKLDPDNDDDLLKVATLKVKLDALQRQERRLAEQADLVRQSLRPLMHAAQTTIEKHGQPLIKSVRQRIAAHLAAIYGPERGAVMASDTPPFAALLGFLRCSFVGIVDLESGVAEAIRTLDILISGDLPFIQLPAAAPASA